METIRLISGDIALGSPLPWAIYSAENSLLLQEGAIVNSERQLRVLLEKGLYNQHGPLTTDQKKAVYDHPQKSVKLLEQAGISDSAWIDAVRQHHEKIDGTGYPARFSANEICDSAKILSLTDMYAALVTPRKNRKPILVKDVLKSIFLERGKLVDENLANQLIREVGIFPPGATVRLINCDVANVTKRAVVKKNRDSTAPTVKSVVSPRGGLYEEPQRRDCSNPLFKIQKMCILDSAVSIDLLSLWGYQNSVQKGTQSW